MTEPVAPEGTGRVARLWADDEGTARLAGHLVTRVCTHWDTVGPQTFPRHVNPEPRVQWRVHLDGTDGDDLVVRGRRLRVEWLGGEEAAAAWAQHGW